MATSPSFDLCVPKTGEELIYIQQRLLTEIEDLMAENEKLKLADTKGSDELCDINDAAWVLEEKLSLIDKLNQIDPEIELPQTKPEQYLKLLCKVKKEQALQIEAEEVLKNEISDVKMKINENATLLLTYKNSSNIVEDTKLSSNRIEELNVQTKKDFQIRRIHMHKILERYFGNTTLKKTVQNLTNAYFREGDDKYLDISNGYPFRDIEILNNAKLILFHPDDPKKIKLRDLK